MVAPPSIRLASQSEVKLQVITLLANHKPCQTLVIDLLAPLRCIQPDALESLSLPDTLDLQQEVIIFGSAPIWLYACLIDQCRSAPWVATYDLRTQSAVVVCSHTSQYVPGDAIQLELNQVAQPAILIGGPPKSGKSVFSHALQRHLVQRQFNLKTHIYRANWDGEGNHTYETENTDLVEQLRRENNFKLHHQDESDAKIQEFFRNRAAEAEKIRRVIDLTLVDVGGIPDPIKLPVVEQCTHYIVISRDPNRIKAWQTLCSPSLTPLIIIHSVLEERLEIVRTEPYLEVIAGPWIRGQECHVPEPLLEKVMSVVQPDAIESS
ncbi:CRISPR-associated ring nuclease Crn3/Csx3 [Leptolyngbya sp. FACHB-711]|uniref:CRISPR-associated ring nuclease Crn3/Csx3 n=1 Tax=Leptolyngbya sp. FACHB-711 TaxID=2692813 RepID=UPI00168564DE|nr:CRISPR-associated ring nuclease Crn3/Csx3 [Leptolyngbya sp. FACHB-711]MBD2023920.1 CRISPR-associated protein Csx3 [Leptolyngbya sp. FACHB-711]